MKYKFCFFVNLILAVLFVSGCCPYSFLKRLDNLEPNEAIAIAKINILDEGKDVSEGSHVFFNTWDSHGVAKYQYVVERDGYIFARLPVGTNGISCITQRNGYLTHNINKGELTWQLKGGGVINYLGDININWNGKVSSSDKMRGFLRTSSLLGTLLISQPEHGQISVTVESNVKEATEAFRRKFPDCKTDITPVLIDVKPGTPDTDNKP
jgi:hypothetical protein